jgi:hypothetical protein
MHRLQVFFLQGLAQGAAHQGVGDLFLDLFVVIHFQD